MAAYGALISLMHLIDTLEKHPSPPIYIDITQVESLTQNVTFLLEFLDGYISPVVLDGHEADPLERRIADAVYAAEDVIESQIVDHIHRGSRIVEGHDFFHDLQKVIEEMNLIRGETENIAVKAQMQQKPIVALTSSLTVKENVMVGLEEVFLEVLDKLTGNQLNRQIIPIVGMGGIGKTTLAINLFENALVKEHFDIRAWTTISQTYNVRETLGEVLFQVSGKSSDLSEDRLGEKLSKHLSGRRYLIIMDDMWSIDVWNKIKFFYPNDNNGSRIIVTTRLSNLCFQLNESYRVGVKFLDETSGWDLFCKTVFGKESCPLELENMGKNIVANCKGLPLSITTIGGLLSKSERTKEYWERIEQNLNSIVINNNDEFCLKILRMSYIYLPNYLKPCFLYMGGFEEDRSIRVSMLEKLWVSEGFLKPRSGKCLETIAQEYFKELVDRNLILVHKLGSIGHVKFCKIHDLLRDLCLKEVEKERFYHVIRDDTSSINSKRRFFFPFKTARLLLSEAFESSSHARSIICDYVDVEEESDDDDDEEGSDDDDDEEGSDDDDVEEGSDYGDDEEGSDYDDDEEGSDYCDDEEGRDYDEDEEGDGDAGLPHDLRLLRIFKAYDASSSIASYRGAYFLDNVFELVNSRYLAVRVNKGSKFPSSINLLWNLHTLIICCKNNLIAPTAIWKLQQLRHLASHGEGLILQDPPSGDNDIVILNNLHTLRGVKNFYLNEEVVKRIPNVKKLQLIYQVKQMEGANSLSYLECLSKLENLCCTTKNSRGDYLHWIRFPHSLKKLDVHVSFTQELEEIMSIIGSLPLLEKFALAGGFFKTGKWETIEGQFPGLKFLCLWACKNLDDWIVPENSHFPLLQKLRLCFLGQLKEISTEIGEIATLKSISLEYCRKSAVVSIKKIVEEQEDVYGDQLDLHVQAIVYEKQKELKSLASANFEVKVEE